MGETTDLSTEHPEILKEMLNHWAEYVAETGLVEVTDYFRDYCDPDYTILTIP